MADSRHYREKSISKRREVEGGGGGRRVVLACVCIGNSFPWFWQPCVMFLPILRHWVTQGVLSFSLWDSMMLYDAVDVGLLFVLVGEIVS